MAGENKELYAMIYAAGYIWQRKQGGIRHDICCWLYMAGRKQGVIRHDICCWLHMAEKTRSYTPRYMLLVTYGRENKEVYAMIYAAGYIWQEKITY